jgi:glycosyltransferase involved in cell wall biosynthesis
MIRIAFFAPLLGTGGTQRHLQQVLRLLDPARFAVRVYTLRAGGEVEGELRAAGVPVFPLGIARRLTTPGAALAVVGAARALRAARIDIVHGYQWRPALVGTIAGRLAGVPLRLASKRSLSGDDRAARFAWRLIGHSVDTIIANAEALREEARRQGTRARWEIIRNGVDVAHFRAMPGSTAAKAALGLDPRRPVIGTVGRLEVRKGHDHLLRAARTMLTMANGLRPQLLLVGDGPLRARLTGLVEELGIAASVHFAGSVVDVRQPLAAMDVFVLPSRAEGMSNALLEAMAAGRPVVATSVGGTGEVLEAGRTGELVLPDDEEAMARSVLGLLADPVRAARLGTNAQRLAEERYSARTMVTHLERFYTARLAARGVRSV